MLLAASASGLSAQTEVPPKPEHVPTPPERPKAGKAKATKAAAPASTEKKAWLTLPPTPTLPPAKESATVKVNGVDIYYAIYGDGPPVVLLHGGLGSSDYWGHQVPALVAANYKVIVMDTRGHGRSPMTSRKFGYNIFAQDLEALLAEIEQQFVSIVGWSDGAITGLQLALTKPNLVSKLFAFGANSTLSGLIPKGSKTPVFASYAARAKAEYARLSPDPKKWPQLVSDLGVMWRTQPNFTPQQLKTIKPTTAISDGEHDEIIKPEHTREMARQIPGSQLLILPEVSHFAMLQNPAQFNQALLKFLLPET